MIWVFCGQNNSVTHSCIRSVKVQDMSQEQRREYDYFKFKRVIESISQSLGRKSRSNKKNIELSLIYDRKCNININVIVKDIRHGHTKINYIPSLTISVVWICFDTMTLYFTTFRWRLLGVMVGWCIRRALISFLFSSAFDSLNCLFNLIVLNSSEMKMEKTSPLV